MNQNESKCEYSDYCTTPTPPPKPPYQLQAGLIGMYVCRRLGGVSIPNREIGFGSVAIAMRCDCDALRLRCVAIALRCVAMRSCVCM